MQYDVTWKPPSNEPRLDICSVIAGEALAMVNSQMPELADLFPFRNSHEVRLSFEDGWLGLIADFRHGPGIPVAGVLTDAEKSELTKAAVTDLTGSYRQLRSILDETYFSFQRFTYVGPWKDGMLSWPHLQDHLVGWINEMILPEVLRRNEARVLMAVPQPPHFNFMEISKALWILECEESCLQGTAFVLEGIGLVTCDHVLGSNTLAFRADAVHDKRRVTVLGREPALDLAILQIDGGCPGSLVSGTADDLRQMAHLAICGYPNYRLGDTGTIVPGLVVGFRTVSGIRRILTNAPIVAGASGAPVLDASGRVIGVAVTGSDRMENAQDTEDHSIIPIDALNLVRKNA
jgi:trypsin-like peptidase